MVEHKLSPMTAPGDSSPTLLSNCTTTSSAALPSLPSNSFSPSSTSFPRCRGLDLLAMAAALEVAGAAKDGEEEKKDRKESGDDRELVVSGKGDVGIGFGGVEVDPVDKKRRRRTLMPSKYQDSILQPWKRRSRQSRLPAAAARFG